MILRVDSLCQERFTEKLDELFRTLRRLRINRWDKVSHYLPTRFEGLVENRLALAAQILLTWYATRRRLIKDPRG